MHNVERTGDESVTPVFDRPSLLQRVMDDEELAVEIIASFLADTPVQIAALLEAFSRGDMPATERLAHRVKGAAANLSAIRLHGLASKLEMLARAGKSDVAAAFVERLPFEYSEVESAMRSSLGEA